MLSCAALTPIKPKSQQEDEWCSNTEVARFYLLSGTRTTARGLGDGLSAVAEGSTQSRSMAEKEATKSSTGILT